MLFILLQVLFINYSKSLLFEKQQFFGLCSRRKTAIHFFALKQ